MEMERVTVSMIYNNDSSVVCFILYFIRWRSAVVRYTDMMCFIDILSTLTAM